MPQTGFLYFFPTSLKSKKSKTGNFFSVLAIDGLVRPIKKSLEKPRSDNPGIHKREANSSTVSLAWERMDFSVFGAITTPLWTGTVTRQSFSAW
jgi:hypothetical protein